MLPLVTYGTVHGVLRSKFPSFFVHSTPLNGSLAFFLVQEPMPGLLSNPILRKPLTRLLHEENAKDLFKGGDCTQKPDGLAREQLSGVTTAGFERSAGVLESFWTPCT